MMPGDGLDAEIRHHILETADRLVEEGWDAEAALREAERRFGDAERWRGEMARVSRTGERTPGSLLAGLVRDARFAVRTIRRAPGYALTIVATLTLGIGSSLAIFALADGILLNPIPVPDADRVVEVYQAVDASTPFGEVSYPTLLDLQEASDGTLTGLAGQTTVEMGFRYGETTDRIGVELVTGDYFAVLGVGPALGRPLVAADDDPESPAVVVLSHHLWRRALHGDPTVVGRTVELNGVDVEIVGVAPPGFRGTRLESAPEAWVALRHLRTLVHEGLFSQPFVFTTRAFPWIRMVGRLAPGTEPAQVDAVLSRRARQLLAELGDGSGVPPDVERPIHALPLARATTAGRDDLVRFVGLLGGVVLLTLLVACLNAATLVSARTWSRDRELGVRQALGAGRLRLTVQLLVETLVLALLGGVAGLAVAAGGLRLLSSFTLPGGIAVERLDLALDLRLVLAAIAVATVSGLSFGLGPALLRGPGDVADRLRRGQRTTTGAGVSGTALVAGQVALSLVLVVGALLFTRTLRSALATDLGFRTEDVAAVSFAFRGHGYDDSSIPAAMDLILASARSSPGVASVALSSHVPLAPSRMSLTPIVSGGDEASDGGGGVGESRVHVNLVTEGFFETLGIAVLEGRAFTADDGPESEDVVVVNQAAAALLWPGENPVGRSLALVRGLDPMPVVGVVADHRSHTVAEDAVPYMYLPAAQQFEIGIASGAHLVVRSTTGADDALAVAREVMAGFDPTLPTWDGRVVQEQVDRVLMPQRLGLFLLGFLAFVTLAVSAVGVHGVVAFAVRRRTRELGIRMALGATAGTVLTEAVGRTGIGVGLGLLGGTVLAALLTRFTEAWLYGVTPLDPASFAGAVLTLTVVAAAAAALPAHRAVRIDPRRAIDPGG